MHMICPSMPIPASTELTKSFFIIFVANKLPYPRRHCGEENRHYVPGKFVTQNEILATPLTVVILQADYWSGIICLNLNKSCDYGCGKCHESSLLRVEHDKKSAYLTAAERCEYIHLLL